jgi:MFS family permease
MSSIDLEPTATSYETFEPSARTGWRTVAVLFVFYFFAMIDRQIMNMLVDPVRKDLGISDVQVSMLLGLSFAIFYSTIGLVMGWMADRYSRRTLIAASVALWGLASASCGLVGNFPEMFVMRMLVGVGEAALGPAAFSMLSDSFSKRRLALALSVYTTSALVGGAFAILVGGIVVQFSAQHSHMSLPLLGEISSWRVVFLVTGLPGPVLALLAFLVPEPTRTGVAVTSTAVASKPRILPFLAKHWQLFTWLFLGFGMLNVIVSCSMLWSPTYMLRSLHLLPTIVGLIVALLLIFSSVPGQIFSGWLIDRYAAQGISDIYLRYFIVSVPLGALFGAVGLLMGDTTWFILGMVPFFFIFMTYQGGAASALQLLTPNELRGQISALYLMITNLIGLGAGPTVVAIVSSAIDPSGQSLGRALAIVVSGAAIISVICFAVGLSRFRIALEVGTGAERSSGEIDKPSYKPVSTTKVSEVGSGPTA